MTLNITHVAPVFLPVNEHLTYGGTERVINSLRKKQKKLGLEPKILASSDSSDEHLVPTVHSIGVEAIYSSTLSPGEARRTTLSRLEHVSMVLAYARKHPEELLHIHDEDLVPFSNLVPGGVVVTLHSPVEDFWPKNLGEINQQCRNLIAISRKQREIYETRGFPIRQVIPHGIEVEDYAMGNTKQRYLLSLSAIARHKGQETAILVAQAIGTDLVIAGNIADSKYFDQEIKRGIQFDLSSAEDKLEAYLALPSDRPKVVYVGPVNDTQKKPLYAQAAAYLMPIQWEEPFGLVVVEALASGTPVVAFNRGAMPEIIKDGETGYLVNTVDEMVNAVRNIPNIRPEACRRDAELRFSSETMARNYIRLYEDILRERAP